MTNSKSPTVSNNGEAYEALLSAVIGIADDYMTSEHHHPDHVLIPKAKFEEILTALGEELR